MLQPSVFPTLILRDLGVTDVSTHIFLWTGMNSEADSCGRGPADTGCVHVSDRFALIY